LAHALAEGTIKGNKNKEKEIRKVALLKAGVENNNHLRIMLKILSPPTLLIVTFTTRSSDHQLDWEDEARSDFIGWLGAKPYCKT
jgi:hypothetical protein